jgi:hypothetical protein
MMASSRTHGMTSSRRARNSLATGELLVIGEIGLREAVLVGHARKLKELAQIRSTKPPNALGKFSASLAKHFKQAIVTLPRCHA